MADNKNIIARFVDEVINRGNLEACSKYAWDDVVEEVPLPGQGPGIEGLKWILGVFRAAFPDLHFAILEQVGEGDKVVSRFEFTGTHRGEFLGVPATGKPVKVWGMVIDHLVGGKMKSTRIIMDVMGMMMQFGVLPVLPGPK